MLSIVLLLLLSAASSSLTATPDLTTPDLTTPDLATCLTTCLSQFDNGHSPTRVSQIIELVRSLEDDEFALLAKEIGALQHSRFQSDGSDNNHKNHTEETQEKSAADEKSVDEGASQYPRSEVEASNQQTPAFTVELSSTRTVSDQVPVTFDRVLQDSADAFSPLLGTFTCPTPGVYAFYWSTEAPTEGRIGTALVKNGEVVKSGPLTAEITGSYSGTASSAALVECAAGDNIWVKALPLPDDACHPLEPVYSSLTGFKLYDSPQTAQASAFTAELSTNTTVTGGETLVYDTVLMNIGNDYDSDSGTYTCRENGAYVVTVTGHLVSSSSASRLRKNGAEVMRPIRPLNTYSDARDTGTTSGTIVIDCQAGDTITITEPNTREHLSHASSLTGYHLLDSEREVIAFSAKPSIDREYLNAQLIEFDEVITNIGGRYLPGVSYFACQDEELYLISWGVYNNAQTEERSNEARLMMVQGGEKREIKAGPRTARVFTGSFTTSASTQAIVQCELNAALYIEAVVETGTMSFREFVTYFSGFRLPSFT